MSVDRRTFLAGAGALGAAASLPAAAGSIAMIDVRVDPGDVLGEQGHVWAECAGSDRAAITLRESWRHDLDRWRNEAGLKRVRFHGIFNDELGVNAPSILSGAKTTPNFQNVDRVYDGLIERGIDPFVELSFMPKRLASGTRTFGFYGGNITPPTDVAAWADFVRTFVGHLVARYSLPAVRRWKFEVWNEPNLSFFWSGDQAKYFELYKATAVALKGIDPAFQVGGPATSAASWISEFLAYCEQNNAPVDFVATHAYAGDNQAKLFGEQRFAQADVIPEAVRRTRQKIDATSFKGRPLWLTEWSCDSPAMIAHVIQGCLPHVAAMSQWTLSATYEELGAADYLLKEGDMGWGMMVQGIPLPSFNTYRLLNRLGTRRIRGDGPVLATRRADGSLAVLVWNLADVKQPAGIPGIARDRTVSGDFKRVKVAIAGAKPGSNVSVRYVDQERGSPMPAWRKMGSPQYPTLEQIRQLRQSAEIPTAQTLRLDMTSSLVLDLPPEGVALIETSPQQGRG